MKTLVIFLLLVALAAPPAGAVVDPQPDGLGVYFDESADTYEYYTTTNVPFYVYFILTNPTAADFDGMEFRYQLVIPAGFEGLTILLQSELPPGVICVDCDESWTALEGNVRLAGIGPFPTGAANVLLRFHYILLGDFFGDFYLTATPFAGPDTGQLAYRSGGSWIPVMLRSGGPDYPVAQFNPLRVPVQASSFGAVKALYR